MITRGNIEGKIVTKPQQVVFLQDDSAKWSPCGKAGFPLEKGRFANFAEGHHFLTAYKIMRKSAYITKKRNLLCKELSTLSTGFSTSIFPSIFNTYRRQEAKNQKSPSGFLPGFEKAKIVYITTRGENKPNLLHGAWKAASCKLAKPGGRILPWTLVSPRDL